MNRKLRTGQKIFPLPQVNATANASQLRTGRACAIATRGLKTPRSHSTRNGSIKGTKYALSPISSSTGLRKKASPEFMFHSDLSVIEFTDPGHCTEVEVEENFFPNNAIPYSGCHHSEMTAVMRSTKPRETFLNFDLLRKFTHWNGFIEAVNGGNDYVVIFLNDLWSDNLLSKI